jgi:POLQ-like helicase
MPSAGRKSTWPYACRRTLEGQLRQAATEWFASHGHRVAARMGYCLAEHKDWPQNIIDPAVVTLIQNEIGKRHDEAKPFPLHQYVHHGLSSQALLFNLVGPLVAHRDLEPLKQAIADVDIPWPGTGVSAIFEFEDRAVFNEQQAQPTSIDLVLRGEASIGDLFIECKLVENGFGACSVFTDGDCDGANPAHDFDSCYLHHIGRKYLPVMHRHGFFEGPAAHDSICPMANHYQFYRELLLAIERKGSFILLADDRSPVFRSPGGTVERGLWPYLLSLTPLGLRSRMAFLSIQHVVQAIELSGRHPWISEFKRKYAYE